MEINMRDNFGRLEVSKTLSPKAEALIQELKALEVTDESVKMVKQDINEVGEVLAFTLEDSIAIAETLAYNLFEVEMLKAEIEELKSEIQTLKGDK